MDYKSGLIKGVNVQMIYFANSNGNFDNNSEMFRTSQDFYIRTNR
jgi:hypothetical protein